MNATERNHYRSSARSLALLTCCVLSVSLFLLGLLVTWSTIKLLTGLTRYPPGTELRWQTPTLGILWAAGCFTSAAAFSYVGISTWWPDLTPRGNSSARSRSEHDVSLRG